MPRIARRRFLAGSVALGLAPGLAAAQEARLRLFWWGNPERDKRTNAVADLYQKQNAGVKIATEAAGWSDYWTRLATQVAGGNAPDLLQMDYRYIYEYARRGTLAALDGMAGLDMASFSAPALSSGKVDGKTFGLALGMNSMSAFYDADAFKKAGVAPPKNGWTWDEFKKASIELSKLNPGKYWGSSDNSRFEQGLEHWVRQRGRPLYTEDGKPGFIEDDVVAWFAFWDDLRKAGGATPAEISSTVNGPLNEYELTRGSAAISFANSNQLVGMQALNKAKLGIVMFPHLPGGKPGHYLKPAMLMSISAKTPNAPAAAKFLDFMVNNPDAVKILELERGVPGSAKAIGALSANLNDIDRMQLDYIADVTPRVGPIPPPPPKGAGEIEQMLRRVASTVAFGRVSVKDGAQQFIKEATAILARG